MEPIAHYVIPTLFILALNPNIDRRRILRYSPLAVLLDVDFFFGHAFLHNIFMPLAISSIVYHLAKKDKTAWLLSAYFLYAHLILDLGFVALLYPIKNSMLSLNVKVYTSPMVGENILNVLTGRGDFREELAGIMGSDSKIIQQPLDAAKSQQVSPVFTQFGVMLLLLLLLNLAFKHAGRGSKPG